MKRRIFLAGLATIGVGFLSMMRGATAWAQGLPSDPGSASGPDILPLFVKDGGMPLERAFLERKTTRSFDPERKLTKEEISKLLWAAGGVNRSNGRRTIFTASGRYPIDILAVLPDGVFKYECKEHKLKKLLKQDIRPVIIKNPVNFQQAGMTILYIMNKDKVSHGILEYGDFEIGGMMENIYLEAANLGLGAVIFEGLADDTAKILGLTENQVVRIAQAVGGIK
jgi:nitroreductase